MSYSVIAVLRSTEKIQMLTSTVASVASLIKAVTSTSTITTLASVAAIAPAATAHSGVCLWRDLKVRSCIKRYRMHINS
jgi:hypothetical protein